MASKIDLEDVLDEIEIILKADLNNKIDAISLEKSAKGKEISLPQIADNSYYRQTWSDNILNSSPSIFYGVEEIEPLSSVNISTLERIKFFVYAILIDGGIDLNTTNRILRYSRAIKEIFQEKFKIIAEVGKLEISQVAPVAFLKEMDSSEEVKLGGITISLMLDI